MFFFFPEESLRTAFTYRPEIKKKQDQNLNFHPLARLVINVIFI